MLAFRTTYFVVESERQRLGQQQLRFGSEGCLRSLKPFPPHGGLESVDGILRPETERRGRRRMSFNFPNLLILGHDNFVGAI